MCFPPDDGYRPLDILFNAIIVTVCIVLLWIIAVREAATAEPVVLVPAEPGLPWVEMLPQPEVDAFYWDKLHGTQCDWWGWWAVAVNCGHVEAAQRFSSYERFESPGWRTNYQQAMAMVHLHYDLPIFVER